MIGYWADQRATAAAVSDDGWLRTGDLASLDGEGYCRISGRLKDMVIRGGENIVRLGHAVWGAVGIGVLAQGRRFARGCS